MPKRLKSKKTNINFRDPSFIQKIIEGRENEPKDIWEAMPEIDIGLEPDLDLDSVMFNPDYSVRMGITNIMLFVYACAPEKLILAFAKKGIVINTKTDVETLAEFAEKGMDKKMNLDFEKIIGEIALTSDEINSKFSC